MDDPKLSDIIRSFMISYDRKLVAISVLFSISVLSGVFVIEWHEMSHIHAIIAIIITIQAILILIWLLLKVLWKINLHQLKKVELKNTNFKNNDDKDHYGTIGRVVASREDHSLRDEAGGPGALPK